MANRETKGHGKPGTPHDHLAAEMSIRVPAIVHAPSSSRNCSATRISRGGSVPGVFRHAQGPLRSAAQLWRADGVAGDNGRLHVVAADAINPDHLSFAGLKPGDLVFWAMSACGLAVHVHHVAMNPGTEKTDGRPVMIGSTDGRSYRGQRTNGYGVHDFRVPNAESRSKLIGYGTPPGLGVE